MPAAPTAADPTAASRRAIERLMVEYTRRTDAGDWDGVGELFARGVFQASLGRALGGTDLVGARRRDIRLHDGHPRTKHVVTNLMLDVDEAAGEARARAYYTLVQGTADVPLGVIGVGRYHNEFERGGGEWRIRRFNSYMDLRGDMSGHLRNIPAPTPETHLRPLGGPPASELPWMPQPADASAAIETLIYTYCERIDLGDFEGVGRLFEHATYGEAGKQLRGGPGLADGLRRGLRLHAGFPRTKHMTTNVEVAAGEGPDSASAKSYFAVYQATPRMPLQAIAAGRYHDRFERVDGSWRFTDRLILLDQPGDLSEHSAAGAHTGR